MRTALTCVQAKNKYISDMKTKSKQLIAGQYNPFFIYLHHIVTKFQSIGTGLFTYLWVVRKKAIIHTV